MAGFEKQLELLDVVDQVIDDSLIHGGKYFSKVLMKDRFKDGNKSKFAWPNHSPEYARRRKQEPMLVQTGDMKSGIINKGKVKIVNDDIKITFAPSVKYAQYHITGTKTMPKRDWTKKVASDRKSMNKEIQRYINKELKGED